MECPHLSSAVRLSIDCLTRKCSMVVAVANDAAVVAAEQWKCAECQSSAENWLCLHCGVVLCGRYTNQHALRHHRANGGDAPTASSHCVCMNTLNRTVYCYECDDYVTNDTADGGLAALRAVFPVDEEELGDESDGGNDGDIGDGAGGGGSGGDDVAVFTAAADDDDNTQNTGEQQQQPSTHQHPTKKGRRQAPATEVSATKALHETRSTSSSDSGLGVDEFPATPTGTTASTSAAAAAASLTASLAPSPPPFIASCANGSGRKLRPRKRTASAESTSDASTTSSTTTAKNSTNRTPSAAKRKAMRKVVGLRNLGNTCFMNSVLQSLSNIREFSCYFNALPSLDPHGAGGSAAAAAKARRMYHSRSLKENHGCGGLSGPNVVEELRKILTNLSHGGDGSKAISPECLFLVIWKVVPQFRGHRQHDAHEFLRYMLDRLHTELQHVQMPSSLDESADGSSALDGTSGGGGGGGGGKLQLGPATSGLEAGSIMFKGRSSIVTSLFGGTLQSEVRCLICGTESKKHDPFLDLSLDIPEKFYKEQSTEEGQTKPPNSCHIADCLSSFTEIEELAETELYYCSVCKCKQKSTKRFWIRRLPNVLCLHIKRFRWNNFFRTKIDLRIAFPITSMDMSEFVLNSSGPETRRSAAATNVYDLAAVIVHHGNGSSCGHYTSYAINNGTWLHFNDHTVKEVQPSAVEECKPYILFYIRRDPNANKS